MALEYLLRIKKCRDCPFAKDIKFDSRHKHDHNDCQLNEGSCMDTDYDMGGCSYLHKAVKYYEKLRKVDSAVDHPMG